jgi:hypothetical protein
MILQVQGGLVQNQSGHKMAKTDIRIYRSYEYLSMRTHIVSVLRVFWTLRGRCLFLEQSNNDILGDINDITIHMDDSSIQNYGLQEI